MTGKKGMKRGSGGARDGAGRPTLTGQFFEAVKACQSAFTEEEENKAIARAIALQKRIAARLEKIRAELEELEKAENSREWWHIEREAKKNG